MIYHLISFKEEIEFGINWCIFFDLQYYFSQVIKMCNK